MKDTQTRCFLVGKHIKKLGAEVGEPRERKGLSEDGREKSGKCLYIQVSSVNGQARSFDATKSGSFLPARSNGAVEKALTTVRKGPFVRNSVRSIRTRRTESLRNVNDAKNLPYPSSPLFYGLECDG